ncbi:MAG: glycosyltransferase, partial [Halioglobus sp.]|nr:glycosyltransferase [Halioglobus sp.]
DGGALPEVVGDTGIIEPTKNDDALVEAIDGLLQNPAQRAELGARARKRIEDNFCWQVCARQMTAYYQQVLAREYG